MEADQQKAQDTRVEKLWRTLDTQKEGRLDVEGLRRGLRKIDHPLKNADNMLHEVMKAVDTDNDGQIRYAEFRTFVDQTEKELLKLFKSIDRDQNGQLDKSELKLAFTRAGLAVPNAKLDQFFAEVDTNNDGVISFDEWRDFLIFIPATTPNLRAVLSYYTSTVTINAEGDVNVSEEAAEGIGRRRFHSSFVHSLLATFMGPTSRPTLETVTKSGDQTKDLWTTAQPALLRNRQSNDNESRHGYGDIADADGALKTKPRLLTNALPPPGYFVAGAMAGVVSRTATAPLDRLRVYLIAQTSVKDEAINAARSGAPLQAAKHASRPLIEASKALWRMGGIRSLFAGNGLNVVKIMPESAIKFGSYECETVQGGLRGNKLISATAQKMWNKNGLRSFYRGLPLGLVGIFPYSAIDLTTFEYTKRFIVSYNVNRYHCHEDEAAPGTTMTLLIGGFSGAFGASVVYPLNLLRTRLQSQGTAIHPPTYTGFMDVTRKTLQGEGFRGLFKGLTPNMLKVVPAVSISYVVYEHSKKLFGLK
ncbi:MAG: hypothetical protein Q9207_001989 [Kuettlingeria erythrocarpa]